MWGRGKGEGRERAINNKRTVRATREACTPQLQKPTRFKEDPSAAKINKRTVNAQLSSFSPPTLTCKIKKDHKQKWKNTTHIHSLHTMPKVTKCSSVVMTPNETWNCFILQQIIQQIFSDTERSEVKQENWTQCGWHWIILLPGSGRRFGGGRSGKRLRFWSPAWHMWLLWSYNGDPLLSAQDQTSPPTRQALPESLPPPQEQCCAISTSAVTEIPYTWAVSQGGEPMAPCAFEPLNFG